MQVHDYEAACEAHFCNAVSAPFDPLRCEASETSLAMGDGVGVRK